jgi:hypothetical protein
MSALASIPRFLDHGDLKAMPQLETVLKRFEQPDEIRAFEKGKFELDHIGGMTIGRAT